MWHKETLKEALQGNLINPNIHNPSNAFEVAIDSRQKTNDGLFIALSGHNNNAHDYLDQAFENGNILALVQEVPNAFKNDDRLILVKDTNKALIDLAVYSRSIFNGKIIGITGSVGKTSVKEMTKEVLGSVDKVFATRGNLNNHFGLPLSLCNLPQDCDYGIFEMGMSNLKEIEYLSNILKPHIAIISNIAPAHIGNFNNEDEIALAKSEIFHSLVDGGHAILNKDGKYYDFLESKAVDYGVDKANIINFGKDEGSNIMLNSIDVIDSDKSKITLSIDGKKISYDINSINESKAYNSLIVMAVLKILNKDVSNYLLAFSKLSTPDGRGNLLKIDKNGLKITIIDDSYNANLTSVIAGLNFLKKLKDQKPNSRTVAIIGDMLELGDRADSEHRLIAKYIEEFNINKLLLVGELTKNIIPQIDKDKIIGHFDSSDDLANNIVNLVQNDDIILVKGSRGTRMEKVINSLK